MSNDMQYLTRRDFLRLSAIASAGLVLAACGPAPATEAPAAEATKAPEAVATQAPAAEKVKLQYQSREPEMAGGVLKLWQEFYAKFQAANLNIEAEMMPDPGSGGTPEKTLAQMVAGTAPDLIEWCCFESTFFVQKQQTLDLQPLIDRDANEVNIDDYYPKQFDPWKDAKGNIQLLPRFTGTQVIYYNKDMFDKAGVAYPTDTWGKWNFDDYLATCKKFVKRDQPITWGTSNYGYGANWLSQYLIRGFGANMVDPKDNTRCGLGDDNALKALEWIRKGIWDDHAFSYGSEMGGLGVLQLFLGGRIAMMEMGPWNLGPTAEGARFKWDVAPMPDGPANPTTHQSVDGTMIWKGTKHQQESWTLLKALTSPDYGKLYAKYAQKQPSRKSVLPYFVQILRETNPIYKDVKLEVFTTSLEKAIGGPEEMFANDFVCKTQILQPAFDQVMLEGKSPVTLIAKHAEIATKFNRGELKVEELGKAMEDASK